MLAGLPCGLAALEWALLAFAIGLVLMAELGNTALETVVDLVSPDHHRLARIAKDTSAGMVLTAAVTAAAVGLIILGPWYWKWILSLLAP